MLRARHYLTTWRVATQARLEMLWTLPEVRAWQQRILQWQENPWMGLLLLCGGIGLTSVLVAAINRVTVTLPNPGVVYLPLVAMLAYHWGWRTGALAGALAIACVYIFFIPPEIRLKALEPMAWAQVIILSLVIAFTLAVVQLARGRRAASEQSAARLAALNAVGQALASELDEQRLLKRIAETARTLTGATFAAFTLRPVDRSGQPVVPAEGNFFHLAAVTGVTPEQEQLFRRLPLGGEGILAPIFRHGVPVRLADVLALEESFHHAPGEQVSASQNPAHEREKSGRPAESRRASAREAAAAYASGHNKAEDLQAVGIPRGHPIVRSFLGVPLLDRAGRVSGGLLLGHVDAGRFTEHDEELLQGLAAQASVALENARLYQEATLQGRELDAIFESISDGIMVVDPEGHPLRENQAARRIRERLAQSGTSGSFTRAELSTLLAHSGPTSLTVPDGQGESREYVLTAAPLQAAPEPTRQMAPSPPLTRARNRPDIPHGEPIRDEGGESPVANTGAMVIVAHDITATRRLFEERRARAEAESRRALLQVVINELPSAVFLVRGADARLGLINPAGEAVWGAAWAEGMPMGEFLAAHGITVLKPTGEALTFDELASVFTVRSGRGVRHFQEVIHRPDGTTLPALVNAVPVDPALLAASGMEDQSSGEVARSEPSEVEYAALVVLQDVSALKQAEHLKDEFIAIAAHELKTPVAAIKGYTGMLTHQQAAEGAQRLAPWQWEALETIDQATDRLVELVDDLLDVSRIQAGGLRLRPEPHDLVALTRRVLRRAQVTATKHTLVLESPEPYVVALVDVRRTEQVVGNLLNNAVKYSPEGGEVRVRIGADVAARAAVLSVEDHGIGIPESQRAQLFGRFSRAENARELGIPGTGLGLFLTRELVERQGGRIWFESVEGRGSTFYVTLPLAEETEE